MLGSMSRQKFVKLGVSSVATSLAMPTPRNVRLGNAQRPSSADPDGDSIACMMDDDTRCAVDIWQAEFDARPFDDYARENLYASLMIHAVRSLDRGNLREAGRAVEQAKEVMNTSPAYDYWDEVLSLYQENVVSYQMAGREFIEDNNRDFEGRFVRIPAVLGGTTSVLALTQKSPGFFNSYPATFPGEVIGDFALRCLVYPMSLGGDIMLVLSRRDQLVLLLDIRLDYSSAYWQVAISDQDDYYEIGNGGYIQLYPEEWSWIEVRMIGNTMELWKSTELVAQEIILEYEPGGIGFGVGMNYDDTGTFSAAFDDVNVYGLSGGGRSF